ncbi:MAG: DUF937 domain-containing protein [Candidatus Eisenbacteria bacterium]|uniref:DUF937 domain-containing protein n=1 Tax=Eiseniibacteriota bacterium TaxID=2212470 RepID=A0A849SKE7_UNCEI|nr:DUF937 domain-containing protein [Candidatus Eisenbacteria bacterium]
MSGILDLVNDALGGDNSRAIGERIGANPQATQGAIAAALPMILAGLTRNAQEPGGADALHQALARDHDGGLLDNLGGLFGGATGGKATDGGGILGHVLGGRREVANQAVAKAGGIDAAQAAQLMAILAPIVMGALGRAQRQQGLDSSGLTRSLQGASESHAQAQPDLMGFANRMLDKNGDGSGLDEIVGGLGKLFGGR